MIDRRNFLKRAAKTLAGATAVIAGASLPKQLEEYAKSELLETCGGVVPAGEQLPMALTNDGWIPSGLGRSSLHLFDNLGLSFSLQGATNAQMAKVVVKELAKETERGNITPLVFASTSGMILEILG